MNSKRMYFIMLGLIGLVCLLFIGGIYGAESVLVGKSKKLVNLRLQSQVVTAQQSDLAVAKKQVATYADLANLAKTIVPQDKDQAEAVREITKIASDSGIAQLSSIIFPASTLGGSATPGAPKVVGSNLTQLTPVPGIAGVYELPITVTVDSSSPVSYSKFTTFLANLEENRRTAQVGAITLAPDAINPQLVSFTLVINEYVKP